MPFWNFWKKSKSTEDEKENGRPLPKWMDREYMLNRQTPFRRAMKEIISHEDIHLEDWQSTFKPLVPYFTPPVKAEDGIIRYALDPEKDTILWKEYFDGVNWIRF